MNEIKLRHSWDNAESLMVIQQQYEYPHISFVKDAFIYNTWIVNKEIMQHKIGQYRYFSNCNQFDISHIAKARCIEINQPCLTCLYKHQKNYSHFLMQSIGAYLATKKSGVLHSGIKILMDQSKPFQRELIDIYGVDKNSIITLEDNILYHCHDLIYTDTSFCHNYNGDLIRLISASANVKFASRPKRIYITRINQPNRKMINEQDIINYLSSQGFAIVDFDKISVADQINYIRNAFEIIAPHGASGANFVFLSNMRTKIVELFSRGRLTVCHTNILQHFNCDYSAVVGKNEHSDLPDSSYEIDLNFLKEAMASPQISFNASDSKTFPESPDDLWAWARKQGLAVPREQGAFAAAPFLDRGDYPGAINAAKGILAKYPKNYGIYTYILYLLSTIGDTDQLAELIAANLSCPTLRIANIEYAFTQALCAFNMIQAREKLAIVLQELDEKTHARLKGRLNLFEAAPPSSLISFHNTIVVSAADNAKMAHGESPANALAVIKQDDKNLLLKLSEQFVQSIGADGTISLGSDPAPFQYLQNGPHNISILKDGKYLSARKGGAFGFMPVTASGSISGSSPSKNCRQECLRRSHHPIRRLQPTALRNSCAKHPDN